MSEKTLSPARHEAQDVGESFVWFGATVLVVLVLILTWLVLWMFPKSTLDRTIHLPLPQYPSPNLQVSPGDEMAKFYSEEMRQLNSAGWVDKAHGVMHIPISAAISKVAQEGIPGWPATTDKRP